MPTETHLLNEAYDKVRQPKQEVIEEARFSPNTSITLNHAEVNYILMKMGDNSGFPVPGGLPSKLKKALKTLDALEAAGAKDDADLDAFHSYMGGGSGFPSKRVLDTYYKKEEEREALRMKNPKYRAAQERGEAHRAMLNADMQRKRDNRARRALKADRAMGKNTSTDDILKRVDQHLANDRELAKKNARALRRLA